MSGFKLADAPYTYAVLELRPDIFLLRGNGGVPLLEINMETGHVELHGDPDEAAKVFWDAVERMRARAKP